MKGGIIITPLCEIAETKVVEGAVVAARVPPHALVSLNAEWDFWRRNGQNEPAGDWNVWLMLAGRGYGKTRTGAEWLRGWAVWGDCRTRLALVGATMTDVPAVMVEGDSGILATSTDDDRPMWEPTLGRLVWRNGAQAYVYSAESPERLRGPQFCAAWCDELAAWPDTTAVAAWSNLRLALRLGERPRLVATTTPRPTAFVRQIIGRPDTIVTGGRTHDNPLLAASYLDAMTQTYGGTVLGRQELDGEMIETIKGALWTRHGIEASRTSAVGALVRVVVGVDPCVGIGGDACGIVVVGLGADGVAYVAHDATVVGAAPEGWARAVAVAAAVHHADCVVAEANNGGELVGSVLRAADAMLPLKLVHASRGKSARAEPVSMLYARGLVRHVGSFPALEDELCGMLGGGRYQGPGRSPDRADALVWAVTELLLGKAFEPRVRVL